MIAATEFRVSVLGVVEATRDGVSIQVPHGKPMLVLALMASQPGSVVSPLQLIDGLWGEDPPATARKALQVHVSNLRKALGDQILSTVSGGYVLDAAVDVAEFERCLDMAKEAFDADPAGVVDQLDAALRLWRGEPFADFAEEEALRGERTRLEELHLGALEQRIDAKLMLGEHHAVLGDLEKLTSDYPYREEFRGLQMLALYRSGRQADALGAFRDTRRILVDELGIDPGPELRRLEAQILDQDPDLDFVASAVPRTSVASTLPARRDDLIGRERDIAEVMDVLGAVRLMTLTGVGGCGKTRLAIEVAHRSTARFQGGVFFVDLTRVTDDDMVPHAVLGGAGISGVGDADALEYLTGVLHSRIALLVVDNCEHVLDGVADALDSLLDRCPGLTVLATSREAIQIQDEHPWRVPSLGVEGEDAPAVELFVARASESDVEFALSGDDTDDVVEICRRLDGIPLAIELAAARARTMTVGEIRQRLDDRFRLLSGGRRRAAQRQQTLQGAVEWSYGLLTEDEQTMLRYLSVFQGGFDLADVSPTTEYDLIEAADLVDSLVAKSLVDVVWIDGSIVRRRLLETIRLFALDKLIVANEAEQARERHYQTFAGSLSGLSVTESAAVRNFDLELENVVAAIEWAIETGRRTEAALTVARTGGTLFWVGRAFHHAVLMEEEHDVTPAENAVLLHGQADYLHVTKGPPQKAFSLALKARALESDVMLVDLLHPRLTAFDFAPVEGASERLQELDEIHAWLVNVCDEPSAFAEVELRRAGQFYSLGQLENALESCRQSYEWRLQEHGTVYQPVLGVVALLSALGRHDEGRLLVSVVRNARDRGMLHRGSHAFESLGALAELGAGVPHSSARTLARAAVRYIVGQRPSSEPNYVALLAGFRAEIGDYARAEELMQVTPLQNGILNWALWPLIWKWPSDEFVKCNAERREWELGRSSIASDLYPLASRYLSEEIEFWLGQ